MPRPSLSAGKHQDAVRDAAEGDVAFLAVDHISSRRRFTALRLHGRNVGAECRLGHGDRRQGPALGDSRR